MISDSFFSRYSQKEDYLKPENIPGKINWLEIAVWQIKKMPVIYGKSTITIDKSQIYCEADLFASAFFMLSRWEEQVLPVRDKHKRFPGNESLAYKNGFLNLPVVNEYADLLWQMLQHIGYQGERKQHKFTIVPTHDIDDLFFWNRENKAKFYRNLSGDLLKRRSFRKAWRRYRSFRKTQNNPSKDPFYVYDHFMDLAEKAGVKASFYFIPGGTTTYDNRYDISSDEFKNVIGLVRQRNHKAGIHPSYDTFNNKELFHQELKALTEASGTDISTGRQHYLRFQNPITWQIWELAGLKKDSTMYYTGYPGFRCGTCYEFPVFDTENRKQLNLREMPLLLMDVDLMRMDMVSAAKTITEIKREVHKHSGQFVFLWHNANTSWIYGEQYRLFFEHHFYGA